MQLIQFLLPLVSVCLASALSGPDKDEGMIQNYHFHTYFFQDNEGVKKSADSFRTKIGEEINKGNLKGCRLNVFNIKPVGPHPIGSFETCCHADAIPQATSWFMQHRANFSVLLHPLTRWEILDHTKRATWIGPSMPLDLAPLKWDLGKPDNCSEVHLH